MRRSFKVATVFTGVAAVMGGFGIGSGIDYDLTKISITGWTGHATCT